MKTVMAAAMAVGYTAFAAPTVTIDKIEDTDVWSTKKVTYTVSGVPSSASAFGEFCYNLALDVTAYGVTTTIGRGFAGNGTFTETLDTAAIFGMTRKDPSAKLRASLELDEHPYVQLWKDGPYFAKVNLGATKPEEGGYLFWWGDTVGYKWNGEKCVSSEDGSTTCSFDKSSASTYGKSPSQLKSDGYIDDSNKLAPTHDAVTQKIGTPWRMMTKSDAEGLVQYCTIRPTTLNGVFGYIMTGKQEGYTDKSIFLPAAGLAQYEYYEGMNVCGYYWLSDLVDSGSTKDGYSMVFRNGSEEDDSENFPHVEDINIPRYCGFTVRPVRDAAQ